MRWILLSPHLDDAVLSAGGIIHELAIQGTPVEIWTVMSGFPGREDLSFFAQTMHTLWGFSSAEQTVDGRRLEDLHAASLVGAQSVHFDFLDAIYRTGPDGAWLYPEDISVPLHPADADLPARIAEAIASRLAPEDMVISPLAVGGHVDHLLVRAAAELLERELWYFAEIPYIFNHPEQLAPRTAGMQGVVQRFSRESMECWIQGVHAYASQLSTLFSDPSEFPQLLRAYSDENEGICLWRMEREGLDSPVES